MLSSDNSLIFIIGESFNYSLLSYLVSLHNNNFLENYPVQIEENYSIIKILEAQKV